MNPRSRFIVASAFSIAVALSGPRAEAQAPPTVTAVEKVVEKQVSKTKIWTPVKVKDTLAKGDALQTGKRSRADVKFADNSFVRLGQLSSLAITTSTIDTTRVVLNDGRILFVKVPGANQTFVETGTGAAAIKGSVAVIQVNADGSAEYSLYSGLMTVSNKDGTRSVDLPVGHWVRTNLDNTLSEIALAPPLGARGDVTQAPANGPFAGSKEQILDRLAPAQVGIDSNVITASPDVTNGNANPYVSQAVVSPTPPPDFPGSGGLRGGRRVVRLNSQLGGPSSLAASKTADTAAPPTKSMAAEATKTVLLAQGPVKPDAGTNAANVADNTAVSGAAATGGTELDLGEANKHFDEVDQGKGKISGVDYRVIGLIGSDSLRGVFGRLHLFHQQGKLGGDLVIAPQDFRFDSTTGRVERDRIVVPQAMLTYQDRRGAIIAGRQRYLAGPVRASFYGSMVRSGGREVMDSLRFVPNLGRNYGLEVSYLYDAFPRYIPYDIKGNQQGLYARLSAQKDFGNFGLNVLRYKDSPVPDTTGITLDFAVPIVRNKVELYGEIGKDPFRRNLRTFGVTLPFIYDRTGFDVYIEHARLSNSAASAGMPSEWAVRVYRTLSSSVDMVATYNRLQGSGSQVLFGLSLGGRSTFRSK